MYKHTTRRYILGTHPIASIPMRRRFLILALALTPLMASAQSPTERVSAVLDALHTAASEANFEGYFSLYAENAVFLGTDATERWPIDQFKSYTKARFEEGTAWTYHMQERNIAFSPDGNVAWFDEALTNENMGLTRGTGVLVLTAGEWKITQYNLTVPVPNELARAFVALIREHGSH
ncbi:MAG: ketosteroid isomerase-like protein [Rhodothermales bacterium]|jgi:ketosteroid isomerase-like protein